ncbi:hypothetical protein HDU85_002402 [Gaertneriomyces sp. JEL0708]|nr:hypothetical protein HDU85_002402 [Gaertneriomyces sp. JEL0708]
MSTNAKGGKKVVKIQYEWFLQNMSRKCEVANLLPHFYRKFVYGSHERQVAEKDALAAVTAIKSSTRVSTEKRDLAGNITLDFDTLTRACGGYWDQLRIQEHHQTILSDTRQKHGIASGILVDEFAALARGMKRKARETHSDDEVSDVEVADIPTPTSPSVQDVPVLTDEQRAIKTYILQQQDEHPDRLAAHRVLVANVPSALTKLMSHLDNTIDVPAEKIELAPWLGSLQQIPSQDLETAVQGLLEVGARGVMAQLRQKRHNTMELDPTNELLQKTLLVLREMSGSSPKRKIKSADCTGTGRRGTELSFGESLGRLGWNTAEASKKSFRAVKAARDLCLRKADEPRADAADSVKISLFIQNTKRVVGFTVRRLFANIVVANYVGHFQNPFYGDLMRDTLAGIQLFLHARSMALATADLPRRILVQDEGDHDVPISTERKRMKMHPKPKLLRYDLTETFIAAQSEDRDPSIAKSSQAGTRNHRQNDNLIAQKKAHSREKCKIGPLHPRLAVCFQARVVPKIERNHAATYGVR